MPQPFSASSQSRAEFLPRREFIREQKSTPNVFAIIAVSGSSFIRLHSFPTPVAAAFQRLFEDLHICLTSRANHAENFCEFTLDGKPWANAKSVTTEKLLVDIFAIMFQFGYTYLSNLDYGRDVDDLLAMAFSKPSPPSLASREGTPIPESSSGCTPDKSRYQRVPFALSFSSSTIMRVISPPLHLTPAILQAVRGAWPRGVVSEKKVGDNSFEFKLKGYKWFQQDNSASDSLRHILTLMTSLDAQSFTLLSSISLKNRSRVKDLWIFIGPASLSAEEIAHPGSSPLTTPDPSHPEPKRPFMSSDSPLRQYPIVNHGHLPQHRRYGTEPIIPAYSSPQPFQQEPPSSDFHHQAVRREERPSKGFVAPASLLRKPAPRPQVPSPVAHEPTESTVPEGVRAALPSVVSSSAEDMTGVGTPGFFPGMVPIPSPQYSAHPNGYRIPQSDDPPSSSTLPHPHRTHMRSSSTRERGPVIAYHLQESQYRQSPQSSPTEQQSTLNTHKTSLSSSRATPTLVRDQAYSPTRHASLDSATTGPGPYINGQGTWRDRAVTHARPPNFGNGKVPNGGEMGHIVGPPSPIGRVESPGSPVSLDKQGWVLVNVDPGQPKMAAHGRYPADILVQHAHAREPGVDFSKTQAQAIAMMDAMNAQKLNGKTHQRLSSTPSPPSQMRRFFGLGGKSKHSRRSSK